jgi:hypothetical protein
MEKLDLLPILLPPRRDIAIERYVEMILPSQYRHGYLIPAITGDVSLP